MIKKVLSTICCCGVLFCDVSLAQNKVGIDVAKSNFSLKEGYGKNIYARNLANINIFGQYYFKNNMFFEYGYEYMSGKKKDIGLAEGSYAAGAPIVYPMTFNTKITQQSPYIGVGYERNFGKRTSMGLVGAIAVTTVNGYHDTVTMARQAYQISSSFNKVKPTALLKATLNHEFNDRFGVRLTGAFRYLSHFKIKSRENPAYSEIRLKNNASIGVGVFYNLPNH